MERPERLSLQSADGAQLNLDALYQIAPSCFTEATDPKTGKIKRVVNFDVLRQLLGDDTVEDATEAYEFNWVGKQEARAEVLRPINKTLRPVKEDSVDWDNTQNLYIEGDNLEVLKLLQKSYLGKVKMIYIDPPYNTGKDFVYHDDSSRSLEEEDLAAGNIDELGNRYRKNTDSNGRFHSEWCSMIYARLLIARSLLSEDGLIFISIDDNEVRNLRNICDEVFGEDNFVNCIAVKMSEASGVKMNHAKKRFPKIKEYALLYKKSKFSGFCMIDKYPIDSWDSENNIFIDDFSIEDRKILEGLEIKEENSQEDSELANSILSKAHLIPLSEAKKKYNIQNDDEQWLFDNSYRIIKTAGSSSLAKLVKSLPSIPEQDIASAVSPKGVLFFYITKFNRETKQPRLQVIFADSNIYKNPCDFWQDIKTTGAIASEGGVNYNNGKKPLKLLNRMVKMATKDEDIILDFFSGSATTAHSVIQQNIEQTMHRKFIMVQLDEDLDESLKTADGDTKETIKDTIDFLDSIGKPHKLTELGKERIRRSAARIREENPNANAYDMGFRVFRVDESNFEDVERTPKEYNQDQLDLFLNNVKSDRTDLDLLFGCMLDWGVKLSLPMSSEEVDGKMIYTVNDGDLVACFADKVTDSVVKAIADKQPLRVIFRDSCFEQDADKINIYETFKQLLDWSDKDVEKNIRVI